MRKLLLLTLVAVFTVTLFAVNTTAKAIEVKGTHNSVAKTSREVVTIFEDDFEGEFNWTTSEDEPAPGESWHIAEGGYEGNCWWMQDPEIGGYANERYLVMDSNPFTVPENGQLNFKTIYSMEDPGGTDGYDGWDGFNVRIKVGDGEWQVLENPTPAYSGTSFYSFGFQFGEGPGVPAWGGTVEDWVDVSFDLSAYAGQEVQIRFAFASDPAYSTTDGNESLYGVKVDNVSVGTAFTADGSSEDEFIPSHYVKESYWELAAGEGMDESTALKNPAGYERSDRVVSPAFTVPEGGNVLLSYDLNLDLPDYDGDQDAEGLLDDYYLAYAKATDSDEWTRLHYLWANPQFLEPGVWMPINQEWMENVLLPTVGPMCDLSGFAGQEIQLSFLVRTDNNDDGGAGTGIYIDNVKVEYEQYLPAPINLTGELDGQNVVLNWEAPVTYEDEALIYTAGTWAAVLGQSIPTAVRIDNTHDVAVKVSAVTYIMYTFDTSGVITGSADVKVWEDNNGLPGEELGSLTGFTGMEQQAEYTADISELNIWIQPGESVFVGVENYEDAGGNQGLLYELGNNTGHTFINYEGTWSNAEIFQTQNGDLFTNSSVGAIISIPTAGAVTPDDYAIYRMAGEETEYTMIGSTTDLTYTDTNTVPEANNVYVVTARYADAESQYTNAVHIFVPSATEYIHLYDDGTSEGTYELPQGNMKAVKFTSSTANTSIKGLKVYVEEPGTTYFTFKVFNEVDGMPGSEILPGGIVTAASAFEAGWNEIRFENPIVVQEENFFIANFVINGCPEIGYDTTSPAGASYVFANNEWTMHNEGNFMIRAIMDNYTTDSSNDVEPVTVVTASNYPNPFNPVTNIKFNTPVDGNVSINVYNVRGQLVKTLVNDTFKAGNHSVVWNGVDNNNNSVASGVYYYKVEANNTSVTNKMLLLK